MRRLVRVSIMLTVIAALLTGCNCFNKMQKRIGEVDINCNPELLSLRGSTVSADVTVTFPEKFFDKNATIRVTPKLVFDGGELTAAPRYLQGEKVKDNYTVIPFKAGGRNTMTVEFPYDERAKLSRLEMMIEARCKDGDFYPVVSHTVAQGVSIVQTYADWTEYMTIMPDNFKRITTISEDADLMYVINSAQVRPAALNAEQIKLFEDFVRENSDKYRTTLGNIYAKGYASPDGPVKFNDELSQKRSQTGKEAISKNLKDIDAKYDAAAYGEDWEGFQKLVSSSNIQDKDLILQVLQMYSSPVQRDEQIKNMSQVYDVLKKDILPQLRRTQLVATADIEGKTDDEIRTALNADVNALNLEEMLYSATLVEGFELKSKAYKAAADKFNDARAYNNYGVVLAQNGDLNAAKDALSKASSLSSDPAVTNNLGALALAQGDVANAKSYLNPLNTKDASANKSLVALAEGDYAAAVKNLSGYNLAIAEFCNGNISQSEAALGNIKTADADYLKAIIAMRKGDSTGAVANLKSAVAKDESLKNRARTDAEFGRIRSEVQGL